MERPRRQTYTMSMYLEKVRDKDIRDDQDVQRMSGAWNNLMSSELVVSILNDEYTPPIILGTEKNSQSWIIDGCQRTSTLMMFRYGNLKISSNIEEPIIKYRAKVRDAEGNILIDGNGDFIWEDRGFDIRRKIYAKMPEELQKKFDEYQLETVIHENYSQEQISRLVRRFNFSRAMNTAQKSFTFCDRYARRIREILKRKFFIEAPHTKVERRNGSVERIILETIMTMFHLNDWKKSVQIGAYVNEHSEMKEFDILENNIARLENIVTDDLYSLFTSRDSFLLFTLFHRFNDIGLDDVKFADFLYAFKNGLCEKEIDGMVFYESGRSLKDRNVIVEKLYLLETLMYEFLGIPKPELEPEMDLESILPFVRENVSPLITEEDISQYSEVLDALMEKSNCDGKLLKVKNKLSLLAIVAYSFKNDIDLDDWISDFCSRNDDYIADQTENYQYMLHDLQQHLENPDAIHTDAA